MYLLAVLAIVVSTVRGEALKWIADGPPLAAALHRHRRWWPGRTPTARRSSDGTVQGGDVMRLTDDERAMLAGERGEAVRRALELQIKVGDFFGAEDFVPIDSAHMMAEIESMGEPCLAWVEEMADLGGQAVVPTTSNPRSVDVALWEALGQDEQQVQLGASADPRARAARHPDPGHLHQLPDRLAAQVRRARRLG